MAQILWKIKIAMRLYLAQTYQRSLHDFFFQRHDCPCTDDDNVLPNLVNMITNDRYGHKPHKACTLEDSGVEQPQEEE